VLLDTESGRILCLNPVASRIFDLVKEGFGENQIVGQIVADYAVPFETAQADVHEFLESLSRYPIFRECHAPSLGEERRKS
jgi:hypothetical protein